MVIKLDHSYFHIWHMIRFPFFIFMKNALIFVDSVYRLYMVGDEIKKPSVIFTEKDRCKVEIDNLNESGCSYHLELYLLVTFSISNYPFQTFSSIKFFFSLQFRNFVNKTQWLFYIRYLAKYQLWFGEMDVNVQKKTSLCLICNVHTKYSICEMIVNKTAYLVVNRNHWCFHIYIFTNDEFSVKNIPHTVIWKHQNISHFIRSKSKYPLISTTGYIVSCVLRACTWNVNIWFISQIDLTKIF